MQTKKNGAKKKNNEKSEKKKMGNLINPVSNLLGFNKGIFWANNFSFFFNKFLYKNEMFKIRILNVVFTKIINFAARSQGAARIEHKIKFNFLSNINKITFVQIYLRFFDQFDILTFINKGVGTNFKKKTKAIGLNTLKIKIKKRYKCFKKFIKRKIFSSLKQKLYIRKFLKKFKRLYKYKINSYKSLFYILNKHLNISTNVFVKINRHKQILFKKWRLFRKRNGKFLKMFLKKQYASSRARLRKKYFRHLKDSRSRSIKRIHYWREIINISWNMVLRKILSRYLSLYKLWRVFLIQNYMNKWKYHLIADKSKTSVFNRIIKVLKYVKSLAFEQYKGTSLLFYEGFRYNRLWDFIKIKLKILYLRLRIQVSTLKSITFKHFAILLNFFLPKISVFLKLVKFNVLLKPLKINKLKQLAENMRYFALESLTRGYRPSSVIRILKRQLDKSKEAVSFKIILSGRFFLRGRAVFSKTIYKNIKSLSKPQFFAHFSYQTDDFGSCSIKIVLFYEKKKKKNINIPLSLGESKILMSLLTKRKVLY